MTISKFIIITSILAEPLFGAELEKLSDRPKDGELQRTFCASRDGFTLLQQIADQKLSKDLVLAKVAEASRSYPPYLADDPKYKPQDDSDLPKRPQITSCKLSVIRNPAATVLKLPEQIKWDELVTYHAWHGPHYTAYQRLTEAGFDPFAHDGEVAFRYDTLKQGREKFVGLLIVPDGWGLQIAAATAWRTESKQLFETPKLTREQVDLLRTSTKSDNPIIKKMSAGLLIRHGVASAEEMQSWLRSEPSLVDTAVAVQLILARDPKSNVVTSPAWMVAEGERVWGGALVAASLLFTKNQEAVNSMRKWHFKHRQGRESEAAELEQILHQAEAQPGYQMIKDIGNELSRQKMLGSYPFFSAGHIIFTSSAVIDPALLSND